MSCRFRYFHYYQMSPYAQFSFRLLPDAAAFSPASRCRQMPAFAMTDAARRDAFVATLSMMLPIFIFRRCRHYAAFRFLH
jgi:hypothetical protein